MTDTIDHLLAEYTDSIMSGEEQPMMADAQTDQELDQLRLVVRHLVEYQHSLRLTGAGRRIHAAVEKEWTKTHLAGEKRWRSTSARRTSWAFSAALAAIVIAVLAIPLLQGGGNGKPGPAMAFDIDPILAGWLFGFVALSGLVYYLYNRNRNR